MSLAPQLSFDIIVVSAQGLGRTLKAFLQKVLVHARFRHRNVLYRTRGLPLSTRVEWNEQFSILAQQGKDPFTLIFEVVEESNLNSTVIGYAQINLESLNPNVWSPVKCGIVNVSTKQSSAVLDLYFKMTAPLTTMPYPQGGVNGPQASLLSPSSTCAGSPQPNTVAAAVSELLTILPHMPRSTIEKAVAEANGDREKALATLLDTGTTAPVPAEITTTEIQAHYPVLGQSVSNDPHVYGLDYSKLHVETANIARHQEIGVQPLRVPHQPSANPTFYQGQGRRKAVLVGINYYGTNVELKGCNTDAHRFRNLLVNHYHFPSFPNAMLLLTDEALDPKYRPTKANIICALRWLVQDAKPGDCFVFHFSGHGTQVPDRTGREADNMDEAILPEDYKIAGPILDNDLHDLLVKPLPDGVRLTAVLDCCHSGTGLDLPFIFDSGAKTWRTEKAPYMSPCDVQLIAGCTDEQTSADLKYAQARTAAGGALTTALITTLMANPFNLTYDQLLQKITEALALRGLTQQHPILTSTQPFPISRTFHFADIMQNINPYCGRM